jgi:hypothetical protein
MENLAALGLAGLMDATSKTGCASRDGDGEKGSKSSRVERTITLIICLFQGFGCRLEPDDVAAEPLIQRRIVNAAAPQKSTAFSASIPEFRSFRIAIDARFATCN